MYNGVVSSDESTTLISAFAGGVCSKYQLEIYDIQSKQNTKLGIIEFFNNKQFSHPVNSKVSCVPKTVVNRIMLSEYIGHNGHTPR